MNLHIYGPQIIVASNTFCVEPTSKIAKETFEHFCEMWRFLINDVIQVAKDILEGFKPPHVTVAASSSGGGGGGIIQNSAAKIFSNQHFPAMGPIIDQGNAGGVQSGGYRARGDGAMYPQDALTPPPQQRLNSNNMTLRSHPSHYPFDRGPPDGMPYRGETVWSREGYSHYRQGGYLLPAATNSRNGMAAAHEILESYKSVAEDNEIVKHAQGMLSSAQSMHYFTRGEGVIKTTQDFFTKAEAFSEDSNKLYKLVRMFSYTVPTGEDKRVLMEAADHLPRHCGQMQLLIQLPGVGKESTFRKVDSIIKENNQIMYLIARVVQLCFANAKKYELDFRGISLSNGAGEGADASTPFGASSGAGAGSSSNLDSGIGFGSSRRSGQPAAGAGGNKRTRVSFLLY